MEKELLVKLKTEVEFEIITPFKAGEKDFAALIPKSNIYLFKYREIPAEESVEFLSIADNKELDLAREAFEKLLAENEIEEEKT